MQCSDCKYFVDRAPAGIDSANSRANLLRQCHRFPPTVVMGAGQPVAVQPVSYWPAVYKDDYCGEFSPR
jgi:hypothetical protein